MRCLILLLGFVGFANAQFGLSHQDSYFQPAHRLTGLGVDRKDMSEAVLAERTRLMVGAQTFSILRDPHALAGAERITSPSLQRIFEEASRQTGFPASKLAAIAYLESWGDANAESPAGPKGIMQFSKATAERAGLRIVYATRYHVTKIAKKVKVKGRMITRTVTHRTPYQVLVRDERLIPARAVLAAGRYLSEMEAHFGGRDLAIFAYHCGEGCVTDFLSLAAGARGMPKNRIVTVPELFFGGSPVYNRELYEAVKLHMARDYSPTYFFRIKRAEELLELYKSDPEQFRTLAEDYKDQADPAKRASNRLDVWLKPQDFLYTSGEDLKNAEGKGLFRLMDKPSVFGFQLRTTGRGAIGSWDLKNQSSYLLAAPSAIGTLAYIAYETRRLHDAMKPKNEKFVPLEVTALVRPKQFRETDEDSDLPSHGTGQVFDIAYDALPFYEKECLDFVLDDLGWDGYLGFIQTSGGMMHIGCSPSSRDFFVKVFQDAVADKTTS